MYVRSQIKISVRTSTNHRTTIRHRWLHSRRMPRLCVNHHVWKWQIFARWKNPCNSLPLSLLKVRCVHWPKEQKERRKEMEKISHTLRFVDRISLNSEPGNDLRAPRSKMRSARVVGSIGRDVIVVARGWFPGGSVREMIAFAGRRERRRLHAAR